MVGARIAAQGIDDAGGRAGDGGPDGGLPFFLAVEDLDVERGLELSFELVRCAVERFGGIREFV